MEHATIDHAIVESGRAFFRMHGSGCQVASATAAEPLRHCGFCSVKKVAGIPTLCSRAACRRADAASVAAASAAACSCATAARACFSSPATRFTAPTASRTPAQRERLPDVRTFFSSSWKSLPSRCAHNISVQHVHTTARAWHFLQIHPHVLSATPCISRHCVTVSRWKFLDAPQWRCISQIP